jgi:hypothetical protein
LRSQRQLGTACGGPFDLKLLAGLKLAEQMIDDTIATPVAVTSCL